MSALNDDSFSISPVSVSHFLVGTKTIFGVDNCFCFQAWRRDIVLISIVLPSVNCKTKGYHGFLTLSSISSRVATIYSAKIPLVVFCIKSEKLHCQKSQTVLLLIDSGPPTK